MDGGRKLALRPEVTANMREVGRIVDGKFVPNGVTPVSNADLVQYLQAGPTPGDLHAQALADKLDKEGQGDSDIPDAQRVHGVDPNTLRGRRLDDLLWGSSDTVAFSFDPASPDPNMVMTSQQLVDFGIHPPRAVSVALVWTPSSSNVWDADGGTYVVEFSLLVGVGRAREVILARSLPLTTPFLPTVVASPIPFLPVRDLKITAKISGQPTGAGNFVSRFAAFAAPFMIEGSQG